jgi:hypothetical protein
MSLWAPLVALADDAPATGPTDTTGPTEPTGATECTGASCTQGDNQGIDQGVDQGINQGTDQGLNQNAPATPAPTVAPTVAPAAAASATPAPSASPDVSAANTATGAGSQNTAAVTTNSTTQTTTNNSAQDTTTASGTASSGGNTSSQNSGDGTVTTGNASIGVTQVKQDNTAVTDGNVALVTNAIDGTVNGDLTVDFNNATSLLTGDGSGKSVQATNSSTGSDSDNAVILSTKVTDINEVQNDGHIDNTLTASAISGDNHSDQNTGDAAVTTGTANVAASLVNLLNTTVENGNVVINKTDVYGDVTGDIYLPDFNQLSTILSGSGPIVVKASNDATGSGSDNTINVADSKTDSTSITSAANVDTTINGNAITGENASLNNTGEAAVDTGDSTVKASNVSLANTTVQGTSLGIVIINALNRFVGFLIGADGSATPLSQDETLAQVDAANQNTGSDSGNSIDVNNEDNSSTTVNNGGTITNNITANAISGGNTTNSNTGNGKIKTGNANVEASAVNISNTTVKNGNLAVVIINVVGNFLGNIFYAGHQLALPFDTSSQSNQDIAVDSANSNTGSDSNNQTNVGITRTSTTHIANNATIHTTLNTNLDTGHNQVNQNTSGANITTGNGHLGLFSSTVANTTALGGGWGDLNLNVNGNNSNTGANSTNNLAIHVHDTFSADIHNVADVANFLPGSANTGNNELNQNTIGGAITTGFIDAAIGLHTILNQLLLALNPGDVHITSTLANQTTGSDSTNTNQIAVLRDFLLSIFNEATVNNFISMLFNTGGNSANQNTAGAAITTGIVCVNGQVTNTLNDYTNNFAGITTTLANNANAATNTNVTATTGNNTLNQNTVGSAATGQTPCPTPVVATPSPNPSATPTPTPGGGGGGNGGGGGGQGGGETVTTTSSSGGGNNGGGSGGEVAGATTRQPRIAGARTTHFPGIGGLGLGGLSFIKQAYPSNPSLPIPYFVIGSIITLSAASWADRKYKKKPLLLKTI